MSKTTKAQPGKTVKVRVYIGGEVVEFEVAGPLTAFGKGSK